MLGSVTFLPALLSALGRRVDGARIPLLGRAASPPNDAAVDMHEAFPGSATAARVVIAPVDGVVLDTSEVDGAVDGLHAFAGDEIFLFGLSMDYHIFILSRIEERRDAGESAREAIVGGVGASAGVVSSAALIMTGVFSVFITLSAVEYKMLGLGMTLGILIDATIVRGVLLPAAMSVLGARAWRVR